MLQKFGFWGAHTHIGGALSTKDLKFFAWSW